LPRKEFEGYSSHEVENILYGPQAPEEKPIVRICNIPEFAYKEIPLLNMVKRMAEKIAERGDVKTDGNNRIPREIAEELFSELPIYEFWNKDTKRKLLEDYYINTIQFTRLLLKVSGISKENRGIITISNTGYDLMENSDALLKKIILSHSRVFDWSYFYRDTKWGDIGQFGICYSIILVQKYGDEERPLSFYAEKYINAFQHIKEHGKNGLSYKEEEHIKSRYLKNTFGWFLLQYNLVELTKYALEISNMKVRKTDLFDKLICCDPPEYGFSQDK
jgi:hypothetical protein